MSILEAATLLCSPLLPSSSGTSHFLRMFTLCGIMSTFVRMYVSGTIRSVMVHSAMGIAGYWFK